MRSPEEVAEALTAEFPMETFPHRMRRGVLLALADHVRDRDAEHEALRATTWEAAVAATEALYQVSGLGEDSEPRGILVGMSEWGIRCSDYYAARRAAVEGAEGAGESEERPRCGLPHPDSGRPGLGPSNCQLPSGHAGEHYNRTAGTWRWSPAVEPATKEGELLAAPEEGRDG